MKAIQRTDYENSKPDDVNSDNRFNDLVRAIINKDVLLIIGKGFEIEHSSGNNKLIFDSYQLDETADLYDLLLAQLKEDYKSEAVDFSELSKDAAISKKEGNIDRVINLYSLISRMIENYDFSETDALTELREIIKTGYFRFVFTTSFSPIVEMVMKEQWGENNVRVLNVFTKDKDGKDIIDSENDLLTPTVYYLFGKACTKDGFVVTDNDALDVLRRWQWDMRESKILEATANKHILAFGCDQDDWLFRFIWYTLKGSKNIAKGSVFQYANDVNLERYLKQNNILEHKNARDFARKITAELKKHDKTEALKHVPNKCDVFISYSRKDGDVADALYSELTKTGLIVWYDKYNLGGRGGNFMNEIYAAIDNCKMFVPILTPTIHEQRKDEDGHPYRLEWRHALVRMGIHGWNDCIPVFDQDYDLYKAVNEDLIPTEYTKIDAFGFCRYSMDFSELSKNIIEQLNK